MVWTISEGGVCSVDSVEMISVNSEGMRAWNIDSVCVWGVWSIIQLSPLQSVWSQSREGRSVLPKVVVDWKLRGALVQGMGERRHAVRMGGVSVDLESGFSLAHLPGLFSLCPQNLDHGFP